VLDLKVSVKEEPHDNGTVTIVEYRFRANGRTQFIVSDAGAHGVGIWKAQGSELIVDALDSMAAMGNRVATIDCV